MELFLEFVIHSCSAKFPQTYIVMNPDLWDLIVWIFSLSLGLQFKLYFWSQVLCENLILPSTSCPQRCPLFWLKIRISFGCKEEPENITHIKSQTPDGKQKYTKFIYLFFNLLIFNT